MTSIQYYRNQIGTEAPSRNWIREDSAVGLRSELEPGKGRDEEAGKSRG